MPEMDQGATEGLRRMCHSGEGTADRLVPERMRPLGATMQLGVDAEAAEFLAHHGLRIRPREDLCADGPAAWSLASRAGASRSRERSAALDHVGNAVGTARGA